MIFKSIDSHKSNRKFYNFYFHYVTSNEERENLQSVHNVKVTMKMEDGPAMWKISSVDIWQEKEK